VVHERKKHISLRTADSKRGLPPATCVPCPAKYRSIFLPCSMHAPPHYPRATPEPSIYSGPPCPTTLPSPFCLATALLQGRRYRQRREQAARTYSRDIAGGAADITATTASCRRTARGWTSQGRYLLPGWFCLLPVPPASPLPYSTPATTSPAARRTRYLPPTLPHLRCIQNCFMKPHLFGTP